MSTMQEESWMAIPDLQGYEISTSARVRSWRTPTANQHGPQVLEGRTSGGDVLYDLAGNPYTVEELMRWTYGEEAAEDFELGHMPGERDRELTQYEINEIVGLEGYKPAYEVGADFRIDSSRVRGLWDGTR